MSFVKAIRGQATKFRIGHGVRPHDCVFGISKPVPELRFVGLVVVAVVTIACGRSGAGSAGVQAAELKPVRVATSVAISREVAVSIASSGSFMAEEVSELAPLAAGRVVATPVDVGAWVNQGDVIARLDDRDARLRLEQAEAAREQAAAALAQSR